MLNYLVDALTMMRR